jgi:hypothetical protein
MVTEGLKSIFEIPYLFLTAAFGFEKPDDAARISNNSIAPLQAGKKTYVANSNESNNLGLDWYLVDIMADNRPEHRSLWPAKVRRPLNSYNVMLGFEGSRDISARFGGTIPAYCAWSKLDGTPPALAKNGNGTCVYAMRFGRGVIMARELIRKNGKLERIDIKMMGVEFSILDSTPNKDDVVKLTRVFRETQFVIDPTKPVEFDCFGKFPGDWTPPNQEWWDLITKAYIGLIRTAPPITPEEMKQLEYYHEQLGKLRADNNAFKSEAESRGWRWALGQVTEAWQLYVVLSTFLHGPSFHEAPRLAIGWTRSKERYSYMLKSGGVDRETSEKFWDMIQNFVSVHNSSW